MLFEIKQNDKDYLSQVRSIKLSDINWTEKDLENIISKNISLFIPEFDLKPIVNDLSIFSHLQLTTIWNSLKPYLIDYWNQHSYVLIYETLCAFLQRPAASAFITLNDITPILQVMRNSSGSFQSMSNQDAVANILQFALDSGVTTMAEIQSTFASNSEMKPIIKQLLEKSQTSTKKQP